MLNYHVSCGQAKKVMQCNDDITKEELIQKVEETFDADITNVQFYSTIWEDWVDVEETDIPATMTKLRAIVKEVDTLNPTPAPVSTPEPEPTPTANLREVGSTGQKSGDSVNWLVNYKTPVFSADIRDLLRESDRTVWQRKYRNRIVQVLFDDMSQHSMYPSSAEYNCVARTLVKTYPILADRACNSSGYDTWKEALRNKFKYERSPLTVDVVIRRKELFGKQKRKHDQQEKPPSPVKKAKRDALMQQTNQTGEDDLSVKRHIEELKQLASRRTADETIVEDRLRRTAAFRDKMIKEKTIEEVLDDFPILKSDTRLLKELIHRYGSRDICQEWAKFVKDGHEGILAEAARYPACKVIVEEFRKELEDNVSQRVEEEFRSIACALLLPLILGEKDQLYVMDKDPELPTPSLIIRGNPFTTRDLEIQVDGVILCKPSNVVQGLCATFAAFYIFDLQYPRAGKKVMLFYQQFLAGLQTGKPLPTKLQRFINLIPH